MKKILIIIALALLALGLFFIGLKFKIEKHTVADSEPVELSIDADQSVLQRDDLINILFIGVDKNEPLRERSNVDRGYGQSDALYLVSIDITNKEIRTFAIPRDTMCLIKLYDGLCNYEGDAVAQITLQYAQCDGLEVSCTETSARVSELFYNIRIDGYFSLTRKCIEAINDSIGGVEVTMDDDYTDVNEAYVSGYTTTLLGQGAFDFINNRDTSEYGSAYKRTMRQELYLDAFIPKAKAVYSKNPLKALKLLHDYDDRIYTNLSTMDILSLLNLAGDSAYSMNDMITLPGEIVAGEEFEQYYLNDEQMKELVYKYFAQ